MPVKKTGCLDVFVTLTRKCASSLLTLSTCSTRTSTLEGWSERQGEGSVSIRSSKLTEKICPRVLVFTKPLSVSLGCISRRRCQYRGPTYVLDHRDLDPREGLRAGLRKLWFPLCIV